LIEMLGEIFVNSLIEFIEFVFKFLLFLLFDNIIFGFLIRLKHPDEHHTWALLMFYSCIIDLEVGL
jgi:hypothetical protein